MRRFANDKARNLSTFYGLTELDFGGDNGTINVSEVVSRTKNIKVKFDSVIENRDMFLTFSKTVKNRILKTFSSEERSMITSKPLEASVVDPEALPAGMVGASVVGAPDVSPFDLERDVDEAMFLPRRVDPDVVADVVADVVDPDPELSKAVEQDLEEPNLVAQTDVEYQDMGEFTEPVDVVRNKFPIGEPTSMTELFENARNISTKILGSGTINEQMFNINGLATQVTNYAVENFRDEFTEEIQKAFAKLIERLNRKIMGVQEPLDELEERFTEQFIENTRSIEELLDTVDLRTSQILQDTNLTSEEKFAELEDLNSLALKHALNFEQPRQEQLDEFNEIYRIGREVINAGRGSTVVSDGDINSEFAPVPGDLSGEVSEQGIITDWETLKTPGPGVMGLQTVDTGNRIHTRALQIYFGKEILWNFKMFIPPATEAELLRESKAIVSKYGLEIFVPSVKFTSGPKVLVEHEEILQLLFKYKGISTFPVAGIALSSLVGSGSGTMPTSTMPAETSRLGTTGSRLPEKKNVSFEDAYDKRRYLQKGPRQSAISSHITFETKTRKGTVIQDVVRKPSNLVFGNSNPECFSI